MKIQFKHQKFQADAARAVVDVFAGQPYKRISYLMDTGRRPVQQEFILPSDDTDGEQEPELRQGSVTVTVRDGGFVIFG